MKKKRMLEMIQELTERVDRLENKLGYLLRPVITDGKISSGEMEQYYYQEQTPLHSGTIGSGAIVHPVPSGWVYKSYSGTAEETLLDIPIKAPEGFLGLAKFRDTI